jgi:hypothetical protein
MQQAGMGGEDLVGPVLITLGARIEALKPVGALGSQRGSSIASTVLSKTLPVKMPFRVAGTTNLGRMLGRVIPFTAAGVAMTALAIEDIFREMSPTFDMIIGMRDFKMGGGMGLSPSTKQP